VAVKWVVKCCKLLHGSKHFVGGRHGACNSLVLFVAINFVIFVHIFNWYHNACIVIVRNYINTMDLGPCMNIVLFIVFG